MSIGPWQILFIVVLVLILFGPSRIPGIGKSIGEAIRGFKKKRIEGDENKTSSSDSDHKS